LFFSVDDTATLHELLTKPIRKLLGVSGIFFYAWVIPAIIGLFIFMIFFFRFYLRLDIKTKIGFLLAGTLYVTGALGVEMIGGWYYERLVNSNFTYQMITTLEEALELSGLVVFIFVLLDYFDRFAQEVVVKIDRK
jgi:uncharacterized BrkB/YihY/UPF0761 family membrane protein